MDNLHVEIDFEMEELNRETFVLALDYIGKKLKEYRRVYESLSEEEKAERIEEFDLPVENGDLYCHIKPGKHGWPPKQKNSI